MAKRQNFGAYLRACRLKAGLGLRTFAEAAGLKPSNLCAIEYGRQAPSQKAETLGRIADALGLPRGSRERQRLFDLAAKHRPGTLAPDVAAFAGRTPGVPVLLRTIENRRLTREDLERLTEYVNTQLGKPSR
ncbi:MAG: helix-turn-helix transcriptional regulator [candidate division NC10 bacterium]|nr:helix-turn-helix transcriptional regulator [candidate division NC10 bacterium]MBI2114816.1 helix-turn-helix transcriptional regulator [candidate division NC10 bacterium]MBI2457339.1 helix-turn-helix transcriptional regulator [candidate division NC10 bacterium]MBI2563328.1 helix-turn-helix transcriptional regulator [candidate division NC10 bacterium]